MYFNGKGKKLGAFYERFLRKKYPSILLSLSLPSLSKICIPACPENASYPLIRFFH